MANTHMSRNCSREHQITANTCKRKSMGFNADFDGGGGEVGENLMLTSNIAPNIACC